MRKIISIIPANGWFALYEGEKEVFKSPVVCFALVENTEEEDDRFEVQPMEYTDLYVDFCENTKNFIGLEYREK